MCNEEGAWKNLVGTTQVIEEYRNVVGDSTTGKNAYKFKEQTVENFQPGMTITLEPANSFFTFNYTGEITLTANEKIFYVYNISEGEGDDNVSELTLTAEGETFVAIYPTGNNTTISYSIDGIKCKETTKTFQTGMVYNLGELKAPAKIWLLGDWDGWANPLHMFEEGSLYVAKNVKIEEGHGFKFNDGTKYLGGYSDLETWNNFNGLNIELEANTYDIYISKTNGVWCAVAAGSQVPALNKRYLYLNPGVWNKDGAQFQAWCMGAGSDVDKDITWIFNEGDDSYFMLDISAGYTDFYIKRRNDTNTQTWNEVGPVHIGDNSLVTITDWAMYTLGTLVP